MKKIWFIAIVTITILFTGCGKNQTTEIKTQETSYISELEFVEVFHTSGLNNKHYRIYKDPVTDIMYMEFKGWTTGGFTWMPDPDTGLPLKYDRFLELYKEYIQTET